jgi:hypothetical protein
MDYTAEFRTSQGGSGPAEIEERQTVLVCFYPPAVVKIG